MPSKIEYPRGTVRALLADGTDLVTPPTRKALEARLADTPSGPPRFFDAADFATLQDACQRLLPTVEGCPAPETFAYAIDTRLADGKGNGWRYDTLPPDSEAYRQGLQALREGRQTAPHFEEELLAELVEAYYSHPLVQEVIGYVGMADGRGWREVGLNRLEMWEPRNLTPLPPLRDGEGESNPFPPTVVEEDAANFRLPLSGTERGQGGEVSGQTRQDGKFAETESIDAVIIGTGAGGAPLLARLAQAGLSVVALEAGTWWDPARDFATDEVAQEKLFWNDERLSAGGDPVAFGNNNSGIGIGGSTLHYTAYTPRPQPDDFRLKTDFGVGADWPIGYGDLEPYFDELETFLGVSGPTPYPWGPARKAGYPLPPLPLNGAAQLMQRGCSALRIHTSPAANAALSAPYFQTGVGWRAACTNRGFCQAGCSVGAKASMDVTFLPLAVQAGAEIRSGCFATEVERDAAGRVTGVVYVQDGVERRQKCRAVFLCMGAVETPRFLLRNDLGNASGQVGRNFMAHTGLQIWAQFDEDVRPYKAIPGGLISEDTHRPNDADFAGGYLLQSIGVMPITYVSQLARGVGLTGDALDRHMRGYNHVAGINILGECLPYAENFLELSDELDARGLPKPRIHFTNGENENRLTAHADKIMRAIWSEAGGHDLWAFGRNAHIIGTCRMGSNPADSVVDADGAVHDVPGLYISDNSTFPSALSANPALTIMAIALRTADRFLVRNKA